MDTYEKKYNEALERAKYVLHTVETAGCAMHKDLLTEIFPELRESEDERIRKKLYHTVLGTPNDSTWFDGTSKEAMLAWLEKQKEQKPVEKQDYSELNDLERAIHRGYLVAGVENVPVGIIKETAKDCITQMKPAEWSEEDEKMLADIIFKLAGFMGNEKNIAWLKSLSPSWKPSEEQMEALRIAAYEPYKNWNEKLQELYEQLKKL